MLYTDAATRIKLDFAVIDLIELGRGAIQIDIPSPVLFLVNIEPLLRWLQSGSRDYRHKCLIHTSEDGHTISNLAYADNLAAMTNSISDLKVQAQKVLAFVAWLSLVWNDGEMQEVRHHWHATRAGSQRWQQQRAIQNRKMKSMINMMRKTGLDRSRFITLKFLSITPHRP